MKLTDSSGVNPFRMTNDGNARDIKEIYEMLKEQLIKMKNHIRKSSKV